jgi:hypothetical protein
MGNSENDQEKQEPEPAPPAADNHPSRDDDPLLDDLREGEKPGDLRK